MARIPRGEKLTANERRWIDNVVLGMSDTAAYVAAFGCTRENAMKNAYRMRQNPHVLESLAAAHRTADTHRKLTVSERLGRLAHIATTRDDQAGIRAIVEYSKLQGDYRKIGDDTQSTVGKVSIVDVLAKSQNKT